MAPVIILALETSHDSSRELASSTHLAFCVASKSIERPHHMSANKMLSKHTTTPPHIRTDFVKLYHP
eukprot:scaffold5981_cov146-Skeletonema_dohrnii-CCMP3373.AAC.8